MYPEQAEGLFLKCPGDPLVHASTSKVKTMTMHHFQPTATVLLAAISLGIFQVSVGAQTPVDASSESVTIELKHGPIDVAPGISTELKSKQISVRLSALTKLDDMGSGAAPFVNDLIAVIDGVHDGERLHALSILKNIWPEAAPAVPILIQTLDDKQLMRDRAIAALSAIGPAASPAIPALIHVLHEGNFTSNAEQALAAIGPQAVPALIKALQDKTPSCRKLSVAALGLIGTNAGDGAGKEVVQAITRMLQDSDFEVAREACWSLEKLGKNASDSVPQLIVSLSNKDQYIRQFSADALGSIGAPAKSALPLLNKALKDEAVRRSARAAIKKIEQDEM